MRTDRSIETGGTGIGRGDMGDGLPDRHDCIGSLALILAVSLELVGGVSLHGRLMALGCDDPIESGTRGCAGGAQIDGGNGLGTAELVHDLRPMAISAAGFDRALYKLGDVFRALTTSFLLCGMQFFSEDSRGGPHSGMGATILGAFLSAAGCPAPFGIIPFVVCVPAVLQALSNLAFMWLAWAGKAMP